MRTFPKINLMSAPDLVETIEKSINLEIKIQWRNLTERNETESLEPKQMKQEIMKTEIEL